MLSLGPAATYYPTESMVKCFLAKIRPISVRGVCDSGMRFGSRTLYITCTDHCKIGKSLLLENDKERVDL